MSTPAAGIDRNGKGPASVAEMCSVRLDKRLFGITITHIVEIVGQTSPQPVPLAPRFVGGIVHYRGEVLTTVSLRQLLDLPPRDGPQAMLVLEGAGGCFGLLVDSVGEVLTVSSADYEPNPSTVEEGKRMLFAGAYRLHGGVLVALDPERLDPMRLARMG